MVAMFVVMKKEVTEQDREGALAFFFWPTAARGDPCDFYLAGGF